MDHPGQHIAVLGTGGVGGLLAALLTDAGHQVTVVAREPTVDHLHHHGLTVNSERFGQVHTAVRATPRLDNPVDVLVVAVKATALEAALERIPTETVSGALVVPLLNGVDHPETLRAHYPAAHVAGASIWVSASRPTPGVVDMHAPFARVEIAPTPSGQAAARHLVHTLDQVGLDTEVVDDEARVLWRKLHFLAPLALVCTHARAPVGHARTQRREDLAGVAAEVAAVAGTLGVELDTAEVLRRVDVLGPDNKPSMLRDLETGSPLELDAIGGGLLRAGERTGVPTPVTARLVAELNEPRPAAP